MLKFEDIVDAPVGKLKTAVDDWAEMVTKLERLAGDARDGMKAKADKAEWKGVNAGVTKGFIGKTVKEFEDAAAEAKGMKQILDDAHAAIKKAKDELMGIRDEEGPKAGIHVDSKGKVAARHPLDEVVGAAQRDPDYPELLRQQKATITSWQKKIDSIVDNCNDTDTAFKNALEANVADRKDFDAPRYTKLDQEEADRAAALAAKGRDLTHVQLQALNELLRDNSGSVEFAKNFYKNLGPEKSLAFFGQLSMNAYGPTEADKERLKDVQELQKNLGLNLATASHDKNFTAEWGPELRKLGTQRIPLQRYDDGPFGYQLLGGMLRYGNYDPNFLNPIAEHVVQLRQKDHGFFYASKDMRGGAANPFNPSGVNGAGYDPVLGVLEALGHSPAAAKQFFSEEPTVYGQDGTSGAGVADLGTDKDGKKIGGYLEFFQNEDYKDFADASGQVADGVKKSEEYMPDALGKALEAATTGHSWDDPSPVLRRDDVTAGIMKDVIESYGKDSGLMERHEALKGSLARMGAAYIDALNYSTYNFGGAGDEVGRGDLFARSSDGTSRTDFGEMATRRFLASIAQDEEGYKTLMSAQQVYEASGLKSFGAERQDEALSFGGNGAKIHGILDGARDHAIIQEYKNDEEAKNLELEKKAEWRKSGVSGALSAVIGVGSAVVLGPAAGVVAVTAVPVVMETVGSAVDTGYATDTLQYLKDNEYKNDDEALDAIDSNDEAGQRSAVLPLLNYADSVGMTSQERHGLLPLVENQYRNGRDSVDQLERVS
ncbi:hypothetical protein [Streptomyces sp. NPDC014734]|uniref:hypothetical protein n=1 Tax=Streptomyces sp. NPDC014734 TaxID=3364886 RepID=UPI00370353C0